MSRTLTELEQCVLAAVRQLQPCSTYQVRQSFARSPTAKWSASAGSIYPVVERLIALKFVKAGALEGDGRRRRDLTVTAKGEARIVAWIADLNPALAAPGPDPVRSRACFLDLLPSPKARQAFLRQAVTLTRAALLETQRYVEAESRRNRLEYLTALGAQFQLEARLAWLEMLAQELHRKPL